MKRSRSDRKILAASMAAGAAMVLCFALRSTAMTTLDSLPYEPLLAAWAAGEGQVDINTAGLEELMTLPGIGETRAQAILDDREANGPYRYPEDLIRVRGIGEGIVSAISDQITTGGEGDAQDFGG